MPSTPKVLDKVRLLRERYYAASPGEDALIALIAEAEVAEQVYNSNAIENSTLSRTLSGASQSGRFNLGHGGNCREGPYE
jgi:histidinol-phosphate/aromatic aminotransferase/cobyric acid decarboxylase-like protein